MLSHDLATTLVAERDRAIRDALRMRALPARRSLIARAVARLAVAMRPYPEPRASRPRTTIARELGGAVTGVSARAGDTHGQGAC
jgi:hypothetical protein